MCLQLVRCVRYDKSICRPLPITTSLTAKAKIHSQDMFAPLLALAVGAATAAASPTPATGATAKYDCTGPSGTQICTHPTAYPNMTFPRSSGNDWCTAAPKHR